MFCGKIDVVFAIVDQIPLVTAVDFDNIVANVSNGGSRLRTFAVSIFTPDLLLESTASCNVEKSSPLTCRLRLLEGKDMSLKVVKRQGTAKLWIGFRISASIAFKVRTHIIVIQSC